MAGIIKRKRKRYFAILPNAVLEDERLTAEAIGVLSYLLSRPHDWQTHLQQLRRKFKCGEARMHRIMREIINAGYAARERTRDDFGIYNGIDYTIHDDPVSEQDRDADLFDEGPETATEEAPPHIENRGVDEATPHIENRGVDDPHLENPHVENPHVENPHVENPREEQVMTPTKDGLPPRTDLKQEERENRAREENENERPTVAEALAALRLIWPDVALENLELASSALSGLSASERQTAVARVPEFLALHRGKRANARLPYLHNYLGQRRWADLPTAIARSTPASVADTAIAPFSRPWWLMVHRFIATHGEALKDIRSAPSETLRRVFSLATHGIGHRVADQGKHAEIIKAAESELVAVRKQDPAVVRWRRELATRGISVPLPDQADWIFMPPSLLDPKPPAPGAT